AVKPSGWTRSPMTSTPADRNSHGTISRREMLGVLAAGAGAGLGFAQGQGGGGPVIRTVLGDVAPASLGATATLFHEHLSFEWAKVRGPGGRGPATGPEKDVALVSEQINAAAAENVGCIVDAGTTDIGRDVGFLKEVAGRTRVHIVAC